MTATAREGFGDMARSCTNQPHFAPEQSAQRSRRFLTGCVVWPASRMRHTTTITDGDLAGRLDNRPVIRVSFFSGPSCQGGNSGRGQALVPGSQLLAGRHAGTSPADALSATYRAIQATELVLVSVDKKIAALRRPCTASLMWRSFAVGSSRCTRSVATIGGRYGSLEDRERQLLERSVAEGKATKLYIEDPAVAKELVSAGLLFLVGEIEPYAVITPKGRRLFADP